MATCFALNLALSPSQKDTVSSVQYDNLEAYTDNTELIFQIKLQQTYSKPASR
jgi:hypothetical protein